MILIPDQPWDVACHMVSNVFAMQLELFPGFSNVDFYHAV